MSGPTRKKEIRLLYLSTYPKSNVAAFSGMNLRMYEAFSEVDGYRVDYYEAKPNPIIRFCIRAVGWIYRHITRKDLQSGLEELFFPSRCRRALKIVRRGKYDGIISWQPAFGDVYKAFQGKKIYISDSTYHALVPYYEWHVTAKQFSRVDTSQRNILENVDLFFLTSVYFYDDAVNYYGVDPSIIRDYHYFPKITGRGYLPKNNEKLELLIVGSNFVDKGIPFAAEVVAEMNKIKPDCAHLTVLGPRNMPLDKCFHKECVTYHNDITQFNNPSAFAEFYRNSDIYIAPSRHECAGIVFGEAASFGLPVVSFFTGGIPGYVKDGETGFLLDPETRPATFADVILNALSNSEQRKMMGDAAYCFFVSSLSKEAFIRQGKIDFSRLFSNATF